MELKYTLEDFNAEIRDAYLQLLPHQGQAVAAGKLDWKFATNPAGSGKIAVCRDNGKIVGLNAFMAGRFEEGRCTRAFQSMDTIVAPEARGKGVFNRLVNCFYEEAPGDILYGFPNLNSSPGFFGKLNWTYLSPAPLLIKPLRAGLFLKRIHKNMPNFRLPSFLSEVQPIEEISFFPDQASSVWDRYVQENGIKIALHRDAEYLNWRLFTHPITRYSGWKVKDDAFGASCVEEKHGGKIGYIMEAFGTKPAMRDLVNGISLRMRADGADAIFAWAFPHSPNYKVFRSAGFLPLPDRIRPIRVNFGAKALNSEAVTGPLADWYLSYLDSDTV